MSTLKERIDSDLKDAMRSKSELSLSVHVGDGELYYGYPLALLAMGSLCFVLYRLFKRSGWL